MSVTSTLTPVVGHQAERIRSHALLAACLHAMSKDLDLHDVLSCVLDAAVQLARASVGVIGVRVAGSSGSAPRWSHVLEQHADDVQDPDWSAQTLLDSPDGADCSMVKDPVLRRCAVPVRAGEVQLGLLVLQLRSQGGSRTALQEDLQCLADHAGLAIRNSARMDRERRRTARFQLVAKVAQLINRSGIPLMSTLQLAADAIHDALEYPNVDIPLVDPGDPGVLIIRVRGGGYKQQIEQEDRIHMNRGIMGAAALSRQTILANDVQNDPRYVRPPVANPCRAELAVPLLSGEELLGVLNVEGDGPFDELDQLTIEAIARHLALAIDNAALISEQQSNAIQEERRRLAFELHDSVTQALSGISLLAQALPAAWDKGRHDGQRATQRIAELAQLAVGEMRGLLHQLSPVQRSSQTQRTSRQVLLPVGLDQLKQGGLGAALPKLLGVLVPPHIRVSCDFSAYVMQVLEYEQALYRVFQEAASNLVRHSGANSLTLIAQVDARLVQVCMRDNGSGSGVSEPDGYGFRSMRQRMQMLGGALRLRTLQPHGFEVLATLKRRDRILPP